MSLLAWRQAEGEGTLRVRAKGFEPPRCLHQQDLNLPRLPFRHARVTPGDRGQVPARISRTRLESYCLFQIPRSLRRRSTWPVALTAYWAFSILPSASMTNVERMTPMIVLP